jgi:hypothetical protein
MQNSCVVPKPFRKTAWLLTTTLGTLLSLAGNSQNTVGTILGTAVSADGVVIPHASVTVTNESTHASRNLMTDKEGEYVVSDLNPGTYTVSGSAPGFATFQDTGIVLQAQQTIRIDIPLKIGSVAAKVEVTAGAPVIEAEMPSISTTVTAVELTQTSLPAYPSFGSFTFNGSELGFAYADFLLGLPQATSYSYLGPSVYATWTGR